MKENKNIVAFFINHHNFCNSLLNFTFPTALKYADVNLVFKKDDKTNKENYRPISFSLIWVRYMKPSFDKRFLMFQSGFRKCFNAQNCLITLLKNGKDQLMKVVSKLLFLTDLSKAFDCIDHELLLAIWRNKKQRTKIHSSYSALFEILLGVP